MDVLSCNCEYLLILMMNLMSFIERTNLMKKTMTPIEGKIINIVDK